MAYVTIDEFNTYIQDYEPSEDVDIRAQIQEWLDTATADIDAYLGYSVEESERIEKVSGYGLKHIPLSAQPINEVISVEVNGTMIPLESITVEDNFLVYEGGFPVGNRNVTVTYRAGYLEVPPAIKQACKSIADLYRVAAMSKGAVSVSDPRFGSRTYSQTDQKRALRGIDQYRVPRF